MNLNPFKPSKWKAPNAVHQAAYDGELDKVPSHMLVPDDLRLTAAIAAGYSSTVYHIAASRGHLGQLPSKLVTSEILALRSSGRSVAHMAAESGQFSKLPLDLLNGTHLVDKVDSVSLLHVLCKSGEVSVVPEKLLKARFFRLQDSLGDTPLHYGARFGKLGSIPSINWASAQMEEILAERNLRGETPLHTAVRAGEFDKVPVTAMTPALLALKSTDGETVLAAVLKSGQWEVIPEKVLSGCVVKVHQLERAGFTVPENLRRIIPPEVVDPFDL
jgi:ankyrin repeat protein